MTLKLDNSIPKDPYTKQLWGGVLKLGGMHFLLLKMGSARSMGLFMFLTTEAERSDLRCATQLDLDCHRVVRITFVPTKASCEEQIRGN